jgi:hypothetical protein
MLRPYAGDFCTNVRESPCTLLQVLINYAYVADCGESATLSLSFFYYFRTDCLYSGALFQKIESVFRQLYRRNKILPYEYAGRSALVPYN